MTNEVELSEQFQITLQEHLSSPPIFNGVRVTRSLVSYVVFCRSLFVLFLWPLCCLSFFDLRILITPLMSSNSSDYNTDAKLIKTSMHQGVPLVYFTHQNWWLIGRNNVIIIKLKLFDCFHVLHLTCRQWNDIVVLCMVARYLYKYKRSIVSLASL